MDHGIGKVFARPVVEIEALLINASFGKRTKHGFTFVGDQFEGFVEELGLKHRRKRKAHYVVTVPPPGEPHHYKNKMCVDRKTLPNHLLAEVELRPVTADGEGQSVTAEGKGPPIAT